MSILLDSLRKSEAQRNVGDAPTIYSTQDYGGSGDSNKRWISWLLLGLTAVAITWIGWQQYSFPGSEDVVGEAPATQQATQQAALQDVASSVPVQEQAQESESEQMTRTPVEQLAQTADAAEIPSEVGEAEGTALDRIAAFEAEQAPEPPADTETVADEENEALLEDMTGLAETGLNDESRPSDDEILDKPFRSRITVQSDPPEDDVLNYWQLPQGLRNELPEFKITVLVYAEVPEDRFLLMDGERHREQDELEGGVMLEEIRREGAVFSYQTYRFLVEN